MASPTIDCNGYQSCQSASMRAQSVSCFAEMACFYAVIDPLGSSSAMDNVALSGYRSGFAATITGSKLVEAKGTESMVMARISSNGIPEMVVVVSGLNAADKAFASCDGMFSKIYTKML